MDGVDEVGGHRDDGGVALGDAGADQSADGGEERRVDVGDDAQAGPEDGVLQAVERVGEDKPLAREGEGEGVALDRSVQRVKDGGVGRATYAKETYSKTRSSTRRRMATDACVQSSQRTNCSAERSNALVMWVRAATRRRSGRGPPQATGGRAS